MQRTIIFGDIHGCHEEWKALLAKLKVTEKDELISVGDLVCKGPSTRKTLDMALALPNLRCVLGNHEWHLLKIWRKEDCGRPLKSYQMKAIEELGSDMDRYMRFIESWPTYIEAKDTLVVHAGIRPDRPLSDQTLQDLVQLRTLAPDDRPWYEDYHGKRLIVHGHWARQGLVVRDNVIGLDTGCVYGKKLTALVLPERKIVAVSAFQTYVPVG